MVDKADIAWFRQQFEAAIAPEIDGTPLSLDLIAAIACQETGYLWHNLRTKVGSTGDVLYLCVGDTIDAPGRDAFPHNRQQLEALDPALFTVARQALEDIAPYDRDYRRVAADPDKFCHGFGIFQYDIQFAQQDPGFFTGKKWADFPTCLGKLLGELKVGLKKLKLTNATSLTGDQAVALAIIYNTGGYNPAKGRKQGHMDDGKYYGEAVGEFLALAHGVSGDDGSGGVAGGTGAAADLAYQVIARDGLWLRAGPGTTFAQRQLLPYGTRLNVLKSDGDWDLVDLKGDGAADGQVSAAYVARAGA